MASTIKSRILLKTGTKSDWEQAINFSPLPGEVCVYTDRFQTEVNGELVWVPGIKIGDGGTNINDLPFIGDEYITDEDIAIACNQNFQGSDVINI